MNNGSVRKKYTQMLTCTYANYDTSFKHSDFVTFHTSALSFASS